jgi:hypothetical protein
VGQNRFTTIEGMDDKLVRRGVWSDTGRKGLKGRAAEAVMKLTDGLICESLAFRLADHIVPDAHVKLPMEASTTRNGPANEELKPSRSICSE